MKKISELTALSTIEDTDILPIVETSEGETKKVAASNLKTYAQGDLPTTKLSLDQTTPQTIANGQPIQGSLTASELVSTDASKKLQSLPVATYPSLTELSYVKDVTSSIQTQINNKFDKAGGSITGATAITGGLTVDTMAFSTLATFYDKMNNNSTILGTADLNDYITTGVYTCGGNNPTNSPAEIWVGTMLVLDGYFITQIIVTNAHVYTRLKFETNWQAWLEVK